MIYLHDLSNGYPIYTMTFINYDAREINCKIVYYGAQGSGKTTNLQYIYNKINPNAYATMSAKAGVTRTIFFDFLSLSLGAICGFQTCFHLYTVPGPGLYDASRTLILKGVDGVVLIVDSQIERMEANFEALERLHGHLEEQGYDVTTLPWVVQYNKQDRPHAARVCDLRHAFNPQHVPDFHAVATQGQGVFDTLKAMAKQVLVELKRDG